MKNTLQIVVLVVVFTACASRSESDDTSSAGGAAQATRSSTWAPKLSRPGLPNLHRVSDSLYRSAQPTAEGMREARALGIKTVVNLRSLHSDRGALAGTGLGYVHLHVKAWHPEVEDVIAFLKVVTDPARTPVLVHCQHGADRTGLMVAVYRVVVQGWRVEEAIAEMKGGGFGYHRVWKNLPKFLRRLDWDRLRRVIRPAAPAPDAAVH